MLLICWVCCFRLVGCLHWFNSIVLIIFLVVVFIISYLCLFCWLCLQWMSDSGGLLGCFAFAFLVARLDTGLLYVCCLL